MIVAIPFHDGDRELCLKNLEVAKHLGPCSQKAVVVFPEGTGHEDVLSKAREVFSEVTTCMVFLSVKAVYPWCKNMLFQGAARAFMKESWLWWEPDSVPLKKGWVDEIEKEYVQSGKLFLGFIFQAHHMDCVGVYPPRLCDYSHNAMLCRATPWDQAAGHEIVPNAQHSDLFQVIWDLNGLPPTFPGPDISSRAVLFHRCKDGTLHEKATEGKVKRLVKTPGGKNTCIVMLGRYGDIINSLPVAKYIYEQTGEKPNWLVAREFADVLDGVSYVTPVIWDGGFVELVPALESAKKRFENILVAQVNGRNFGVSTQCESFSQDSWRQMGFLKHWGKLPLVFDKRDSARESNLCRLEPKKRILVNVTGKSSPYKRGQILLQAIRQSFPNAQVIDLSAIKAHRIYDLLGLFDASDCLVTIDTSTTHLVLGSKIRVVNLVVDTPTQWHGATPKGRSVYANRYSEVNHGEIVSAIQGALDAGDTKFFHVFSDYPTKNPVTAARERLARRTWEIQYAKGDWTSLPVKDSQLPRLFDEEKKKLPYIIDLVDFAASRANDNDVIVLTNTDTCFSLSLTLRLEQAIAQYEALIGHRRDFNRLDDVLTDPELIQGDHYPGGDIFAFRKKWWSQNRFKYPDGLVVGREWWDFCMLNLVLKNGGAKIVDTVYHQIHDSEWKVDGSKLAGNVNNDRITKQFRKTL